MFGKRPFRALGRARAFRASALIAAALALSGSVEAASRRHRSADSAADAGLANVTYCGFRLLSDGRSLVYVNLTQKVNVSEEKRGNVVVYVLEGAHVALKNNKNPLITSSFASVLESARLVSPNQSKKKRSKAKTKDALPPRVELVLKLRSAVTPTHVLRDAPEGAVLEVTLPALAGK